MDIINGGRALMNIRHKLNILIKNKRNLDFNIDDAEISYLSKGRTNDSYLLDFNNFKLVLRLNSKNDFDLGINRENEALILKTLDNQSFMPNLIYIDEFYKFIIETFVLFTVYFFHKYPPIFLIPLYIIYVLPSIFFLITNPHHRELKY